MFTIYGIYAQDAECCSSVAFIADGKLAQRLCEETNKFLQNSLNQLETWDAEIEDAIDKGDFDEALDIHSKRIAEWNEKCPLHNYAPNVDFENCRQGLFVKPIEVAGTPQFDPIYTRYAVDRMRRFHVKRLEDLDQMVQIFQNTLAFLTKKRP
jgi:hypothetical protein